MATSLPLYEKAHSEFKKHAKDQANQGLVFERFFDQYTLTSASAEVEASAKATFIEKFASKRCGNSDHLTRASERQFALAHSQQGSGKIYQLDGHFVTGMGNAHPVENGFLWHRTLGVPYLTGAQVKGMVRAVIEQYYDGDDKACVLHQWFGSDHKNPQATQKETQAGGLIFFDAIPYQNPQLTADVMTPHMGQWYSQGAEIKSVTQDTDSLPADWHDPVPVPFLAVKDAKFLFTIAPRAGSGIDIDDVFACLDHALTYQGAGAKTQVGYGFMSVNDHLSNDFYEKIQAKEQEKADGQQFETELAGASSDLQKALMHAINDNNWRQTSDEVKGHFNNAIGLWLDKLEANPDDHESIKLFTDVVRLHFSKQMKKPHDKKIKQSQRAWLDRLLALQP